MTTVSLTLAPPAPPPPAQYRLAESEPPEQYRLAESTRQAILAATPRAKLSGKIEEQRQKFILYHGNDGLSQ